MSRRREVRVSEAFFNQLDVQLGPSRRPGGQPSATDYLVMELPAIVERFATEFDSPAEVIEDVPAPRMLITTGVLVAGVGGLRDRSRRQRHRVGRCRARPRQDLRPRPSLPRDATEIAVSRSARSLRHPLIRHDPHSCLGTEQRRPSQDDVAPQEGRRR